MASATTRAADPAIDQAIGAAPHPALRWDANAPIDALSPPATALPPQDALDRRMMRVALTLARRGLGRTAPNPSVGALVVRFDALKPVIVGRGVTAPGGRPHAERIALDQAGERAIGATLYVTLEPCARRSTLRDGSSCTEAVLCSGLTRVVIGARDPSPFAAGQGARRLRAHGIAVEEDVCAEEARMLNLGHELRVTAHRPLVLLKLARTQDGFAATADRRPLAITGEAARAHTHLTRAGADAIAVGIGTVLADDPDLTCRLPGLEDRSPIRVVFDTHLRLPVTSRIARTAARVPSWVLAGPDAPVEAERRLLGAGVEVLRIGLDGGSERLDLAEALARLAERGITRLMLEGGPMLADRFAEAGLIDGLDLLTGAGSEATGLPAIGPHLAAWIEAHAASRSESRLGADRLERFRAPPA